MCASLIFIFYGCTSNNLGGALGSNNSSSSSSNPSGGPSGSPTANPTPPQNGPYTLQNQQPNMPVAYSLNPNSIMGKRLPSGVLNHLWGNTATVTNSNLYGKCISTDCGNAPTGGAGSSWGSTSYSSYGNYGTTAFYWATASDPYWIVNGCVYCVKGWTSGPFHAPSNMLLPGANFTGDADAQLTIWDQASGMVVSVYGSPGYTVPTYTGTCPGTAGAGTVASPCVLPGLTSASGAVSNFFTDRDWQSTNLSSQLNMTSSLGLAPNAGMVRVNEIIAGLIPHAEYDSTDCVSAPGGTKLPAVFPERERLGRCLATPSENRAPIGHRKGCFILLITLIPN